MPDEDAPLWLVGYDGSPPSKKALEWTTRRAKAEGGKVVLVAVVPASVKDSFFTNMLLPDLDLASIVQPRTFEKNAQRRLAEAASSTGLPSERVETRVLTGEAWAALVEAAARLRPEAIVLGEKSYEKVADHNLGAVAERVVRHAGCPVVVVR